MAGRRLRTADYGEEARQRLGTAIAEAREALGFKFRPAFAKHAKVAPRSLADMENGVAGVGEANLKAVARALPSWTEDTPRTILDGGPVPPVARNPMTNEAPQPSASRAPAPKEYSAEQRARWRRMSVDEIIERGEEIGTEVAAELGDVAGVKARIRYLRAALQEKETALSPEDIPQ